MYCGTGKISTGHSDAGNDKQNELDIIEDSYNDKALIDTYEEDTFIDDTYDINQMDNYVEDSTECTLGFSENDECDQCRIKTRRCNNDGTWGDWGQCILRDGAECTTGSSKACNIQGQGIQVCQNDCTWGICQLSECVPAGQSCVVDCSECCVLNCSMGSNNGEFFCNCL